MNTPIYDFVKSYNNNKTIRAHMPGHKGKGILSESMDITEICGADNLFDANDIIKESENNASNLFKTKATIYSAFGSTSCIQTMLALAAQKAKNRRPLFVAMRNSHKAFLNTCILLDCDIVWVYPKESNISITTGKYTKECFEKAIQGCKHTPDAVFITSPDYAGNMLDIKAISEVCKKHNTLLIVDNAHGSYLAFLTPSKHPIHLGADMCCDSAHKTLPVLTGGAYIHFNDSINNEIINNAKSAMSLFTSTSPSYLIIESLDLCNKILDDNFKEKLDKTIKEINILKETAINTGLDILNSDPLKLTIIPTKKGLTGTQFAQKLRENNIECEYADNSIVVMMFSVNNTTDDFNAIKNAFINIKGTNIIINEYNISLCPHKQIMSIREAALAESEIIEVKNAYGRICSKTVTVCPPAIPVTVSGEEIDDTALKIYKKYSISDVCVVK